MARPASGRPKGPWPWREHQSAGRGRLDRRWEAPPGASLLVSVLFRPGFEPAELHLCTAVMALAASEACRRVAGVDPVLKWPNDLLVGEEKLAGVLAEAEFGGGAGGGGGDGDGGGRRWSWGSGSTSTGPVRAGVGGTCLRDLGADAVDRTVLLDALLEALSTRRALLDSAAGRREVLAELRNRCATLGRRVRVELAAEAVTGVATEIDDAGHLVVQTAEGPRTVSAGDVVHLRPG